MPRLARCVPLLLFPTVVLCHPPAAPGSVTGLQPPKTLRAACDADSVTLTWPAVPGAAGYRVYHAAEGERIQGPGEAVIEARWTGTMPEGAFRRYAVAAVGPDGTAGRLSRPAVGVHLRRPWGIVVRRDGARLVRDAHYPRTLLQEADGSWAGFIGNRADRFAGCQDIALDRAGRILSTLSSAANTEDRAGFMVQKPGFATAARYLQPEGKEPGRFRNPVGIAANAKGQVFVADSGNNRIQEFTPDGNFVRLVGEDDLDVPMKMAFDSRNRMWVADSGSNRVLIYTADARGRYTLSQVFSTAIKEPCYIAIDAADRVFISANRVSGVYMLDAQGGIAEKWLEVDGQPLSGPRGLAFDGRGNLLIVDESTRRVVSVKLPPVVN